MLHCSRIGLVVIGILFWNSSLLSAGEIITIAGNGADAFSGDGGPALKAGFGQPFGIAHGPDGALYICEYSNHIVRRLDEKTGIVTTVAGTGRKGGYSGDGGPANQATMNEPHEIVFDAAGNYYLSDMKNHAIRKVDGKTQVMTTIAGSGKSGFAGDGGPATQAQMNLAIAVALDGPQAKGLLICDISNHRVRRVDFASGLISTFAGTGKRDATKPGDTREAAALNGPRTIVVDANGDVIIVLREGSAVYRLKAATGTFEHVAGTGKAGYSGDGGDAKLAQVSGPKGVALDREGNIILADTESHTIRRIRKADNVIETIVGDGKKGNGGDGDPLKCQLNRPHGVYVAPDGTLYIGDSSNNKVRKLK